MIFAAQDSAYYSELSEQLLGARDQAQLMEALLREDLALFSKVVLSLEIGPHIVAWSDLVSAQNRIGLNAARDHGKCLTGDSLILTSSGQRVRADQWRGGHVMALNTQTLMFEPAYAPAARERAPEHTQTVITRTGRRVTVNDEHPFRLWDRWISASDLQLGARIAVPYGLALNNTKQLSGAWLLGLLVGDGSLIGASRFQITKKDQLTVASLRAEISLLGWKLSDLGSDVYSIHDDYRRNGPLAWLRAHGLSDCSAYEKRVPLALFECGQQSIAEFLAGYLDSDGSVNLHGGGSVSFSSVSSELLRDVQHLLMRLSVVSSLTPHCGTYKGEPYAAWILSIRGKDLLCFARHVRSRGKRGAELEALLYAQQQRGPCSGRAIDRFPAEIYSLLKNKSYWFEQRGLSRPVRGCAPTREKLGAIAVAEQNEELANFANAAVLWDEVVAIEDAGIQTTWSLAVPGLENYVANDIVQHNSAFFSYAYPIWRAWRQPGCEVYLFSNTLEQAQEFLDIILYGRNNLKGMVDIPLVSHLVPERVGFHRSDPRLRLNRSDARLTNGSRIRVAGYGKAMRGRHPQYVVLDDPINDEDMWSETTRRKNIEYFKSAITNMVPPNGQLIVVGTPFSANDLYGYLRKNRSYVFAKFPGIVRADDGTERALFPFRWTLAQLKGRQKEIGSVAFAREILCCRPGTLIETEHGALPIESVTVGTLVLTHTGAWEPVLRTMRRAHKGALIRVKSTLHVTPGHPILTQDGWIDAECLAATDQVTFPIPKQRHAPVASVSLIDGTSVPYLRTREGDRVYARGSAKGLVSGATGKRGAKSVPATLVVNEELLRLVGLWLAEGHISSGKTIIWSFGLHELETLAKDTVRLVRSVLGLAAQTYVNKPGNTVQVVVGNRLFADFLTRSCGLGAANKQIPLWVRDLEPRLIWALILGYVDGDGHVESDKAARVSSVSKELLVAVRFLFARCGIFSTLRQATEGRIGSIQGRVCKMRASWMLTVSGGGYLAVASRRLPDRPFSWGRLHTGYGVLPYDGEVFNIEVARDNSYVADGVTVHNCEPISDEISIFPEHLFPPCYDSTLCLRMSKADIRAHGLSVYFGVDIARSASVGADYFVIFVIGRDRKGNQYVLDIRRSKGLPFRDQLHEIEIAAELYDPTLILIESNAMQQLYSSELRRETDLPVKEFVTLATNKYPLDKGVPGQRLLLENRKLVIPRGDEYSIVMTDIWMQEARQFGYIDGKLQGVGSHDDCVLPGALVTTRRGLVPIESVAVGDEVLTHNSRWQKVTGTTSRHYDGVVHEICPAGSLPFTVTAEHPIWRALPTAQKSTNRLGVGEWGWRDAASIRAGRKLDGDWLCYPIPPCRDELPAIDLACFVEQPPLPNGGPVWKIEDQRVWWRADRVLPRYVATADPEWWLLLGLFLAEGSVGGAAGGKHLVQFALHARETYLADFIRKAALRFFAAPTRVIYPKGTNSMVVCFGSRPAAALFGLLGKSKSKALPWHWMNAPKELRLWMVRGWLLGDGSLGHHIDGNGSHLGAVSISRNLIEQMRITLLQSGLAAHVRPFDTGSTNPAWHLGIPAADTDVLLRDAHATEQLRWAAREMRSPGIERRELRVGATEVHLRIRSNAARHYCGPVFNLHVAEDESYSLEGIAVHNCVMAWWIATEASRMGGFGFAFDDGDREDEDEETTENWESVLLGDGDSAEDAPLF